MLTACSERYAAGALSIGCIISRRLADAMIRSEVTAQRSGSSPAHLSARLMLIATAVLFSTGGAVIKGTALNAWQVGGMRSAIAAAAILLLIPDARRNWSLRQVPVALAYGVTLLLYVT